MATNKKVIKEIQYNSAVIAMICMGGAIERQLVNCTTRLVQSLDCASHTNHCKSHCRIVLYSYFFDNFLICGHWPLIFDTLTFNRILYRFL